MKSVAKKFWWRFIHCTVVIPFILNHSVIFSLWVTIKKVRNSQKVSIDLHNMSRDGHRRVTFLSSWLQTLCLSIYIYIQLYQSSFYYLLYLLGTRGVHRRLITARRRWLLIAKSLNGYQDLSIKALPPGLYEIIMRWESSVKYSTRWNWVLYCHKSLTKWCYKLISSVSVLLYFALN